MSSRRKRRRITSHFVFMLSWLPYNEVIASRPPAVVLPIAVAAGAGRINGPDWLAVTAELLLWLGAP
jgi:hypothetical protein